MISNRLAHHLASLAWAAQRGFHEPLKLVTSVVLACPAHYTLCPTCSNLFFFFFLPSRMLFFRNKKMTKIPRLGKSYSPPLVDRLFSHDSQPGLDIVRERVPRKNERKMSDCGRVIESTTSLATIFPVWLLFPSASWPFFLEPRIKNNLTSGPSVHL